MPLFDYEATTADGRLMKGTLEADSNEQATSQLAAMGLAISSVAKAKAPPARTAIGRNEFLLFNHQLAAIADAGLPLERSLRELAGDVASGRLRALIQAVADDLEAGLGVHEAFERHRSQFPPLYGRLVEAGVATGRLGEMLTSLNRHLEIAGQTRRIVLESLFYPVTVLVIAAGVFTMASWFIIPRYVSIFSAMGIKDSSLMKVLRWTAGNIGWLWLGAIALVGALAGMKVVLRFFPDGRRFTERLLLAVPVFGRVYYTGILSRLADAMATLVAAGCDMPLCLRLGAVASGSAVLQDHCERLARAVEQGRDPVTAGREQFLLPGLFLYSMQVGVRRNELQDNLYNLAQMYAGQGRAYQGRLQAALLPVLLVVLGVFIGLVVLALFMPYVQLLEGMR